MLMTAGSARLKAKLQAKAAWRPTKMVMRKMPDGTGAPPRRQLCVEHVDTKLNSSDLLTKPLPLPTFLAHRKRLMNLE